MKKFLFASLAAVVLMSATVVSAADSTAPAPKAESAAPAAEAKTTKPAKGKKAHKKGGKKHTKDKRKA